MPFPRVSLRNFDREFPVVVLYDTVSLVDGYKSIFGVKREHAESHAEVWSEDFLSGKFLNFFIVESCILDRFHIVFLNCMM